MKILITVLIGLFLLSNKAEASGWCEESKWITFEMFSQHWKGRKGKNQSHHRYGLGCDGISVSTYKGSYDDRIYAIEKIDRDYFKCYSNGICLGHRYGLYYGYEKMAKVIPSWMPNVSYEFNNKLMVDVACFPGVCGMEFSIIL